MQKNFLEGTEAYSQKKGKQTQENRGDDGEIPKTEEVKEECYVWKYSTHCERPEKLKGS